MKLRHWLCFFLIAPALLAQSNWNYVWSLHQKPFQDPQVGSEMAIVKAGFDTDEDGWGEFLCAYTDLENNYLLMYEATGNNTYELVWSFHFPFQANTFAGIAVGDTDNNGIVEIVATMPSVVSPEQPNPERLWVFQWNGVQGENKYGVYSGDDFVPNGRWNYDVEDNIDFRPYSLTIEDIDNDGKNELITGVRQSDRGREVLVAEVAGEWLGFGGFQVEYNLQGLSGGSLYNVTTGDLDGDGFKEIYAFIWNMFTLHIIEVMGDNQYEQAVSLETLYTDQGIDYGALDAVRVADVNNDGVNEMYIAGTEPENTVFIITGINDVSQITADDVQELMHFPLNAGGKLRAMYIDDMDNDGLMSLMVAGETNGRIYDVEYKGSGDPADSANWEITIAFDMFEHSGFAPDASPTIDPRLFYGHPANDMDQDGDKEYVFVNYRTSFEVWEGDGYVWMIENQTGLSVDEESLIPEKTTLYQNYPNPFNPSTEISFYLKNGDDIQINLYDITGSKVAELANGYYGQGDHKIKLDASGLAAGIYLYRLQTGQGSFSKKLVLLK